MTTQIVYSDEFKKHTIEGHPENAGRLDALMNELRKAPFYNDLDVIKPEILDERILYDVHSERMINQIKLLSKDEKSWIDLDTYVCKSDYETARLAAGGVLLACNNVMSGKVDNAYAVVRPPGHHATKERSMGFCLFNNAAIAANELSKKGKRILVMDFDVHHGNGIQDIFFDRKNVMYQSIHLSPHYPGTGAVFEIGIGEGEGYTINAPLSYGNGNQAATEILDEIFLPIAKQYKPDMIIFSCGYDSHHTDPLGGLCLTADFYAVIMKKYQKIQPKIACTIEGGYNLNWIGKCLVSQVGQLVGHNVKIGDKTEENKNVDTLIGSIKNELNKYWKI